MCLTHILTRVSLLCQIPGSYNTESVSFLLYHRYIKHLFIFAIAHTHTHTKHDITKYLQLVRTNQSRLINVNV